MLGFHRASSCQLCNQDKIKLDCRSGKIPRRLYKDYICTFEGGASLYCSDSQFDDT